MEPPTSSHERGFPVDPETRDGKAALFTAVFVARDHLALILAMPLVAGLFAYGSGATRHCPYSSP